MTAVAEYTTGGFVNRLIALVVFTLFPQLPTLGANSLTYGG